MTPQGQCVLSHGWPPPSPRLLPGTGTIYPPTPPLTQSSCPQLLGIPCSRQREGSPGTGCPEDRQPPAPEPERLGSNSGIDPFLLEPHFLIYKM